MSYISLTIGLLMSLISCIGCGSTGQYLTDTASAQVGDERTFEQVIEQIKTPEQLSEWMKRNINYRGDINEKDFRAPQETFKLGYGDCDDFALFASFWADYHGIDNVIISLYNDNGYGHCICIIHGIVFSNADIIYCDTDPIAKVFDKLCPSWTVYSFYPENIERRRGE